MGTNEEDFDKRTDRRLWKEENIRRAEQGRELIPLPESLLDESEMDIAIENKIREDREKAKYGYPDNIVFNRKQKFDNDFKLTDYEDEDDDDEDSDDFDEEDEDLDEDY